MPIKLITSILAVAVIGIFAGFNWGEGSRCSVDFVFLQTPELPVFIIIIVSFLLGVVVMSLVTICGKMFGGRKEEAAPVVQTEEKQEAEQEKVDLPPPQEE